MTRRASFPAVTASQTASWLGRNLEKPNAFWRSSGRVVKVVGLLVIVRSEAPEFLGASETAFRIAGEAWPTFVTTERTYWLMPSRNGSSRESPCWIFLRKASHWPVIAGLFTSG